MLDFFLLLYVCPSTSLCVSISVYSHSCVVVVCEWVCAYVCGCVLDVNVRMHFCVRLSVLVCVFLLCICVCVSALYLCLWSIILLGIVCVSWGMCL